MVPGPVFEPSQIAAARKRLGLSQSELARRSGVSQSLIAKIEAGGLDPSFSRLKALSDALERSQARKPVTAERIMHRGVVLMYATDPIEHAIEHMARHGISQLPVYDDGALAGTVTERNLLHFVAQHPGDLEAMRRPVREVMGEALPQVAPESTLDALVSLLDLFPAVLVAANGRLQGIVTRSDLIRGAHGTGPAGGSGGAQPEARPG